MSKQEFHNMMFGLGVTFVVALFIALFVGVTRMVYTLGEISGAIAHHEGRVAVTVLPDGSKVVTTMKESK